MQSWENLDDRLGPSLVADYTFPYVEVGDRLECPALVPERLWVSSPGKALGTAYLSSIFITVTTSRVSNLFDLPKLSRSQHPLPFLLSSSSVRSVPTWMTVDLYVAGAVMKRTSFETSLSWFRSAAVPSSKSHARVTARSSRGNRTFGRLGADARRSAREECREAREIVGPELGHRPRKRDYGRDPLGYIKSLWQLGRRVPAIRAWGGGRACRELLPECWRRGGRASVEPSRIRQRFGIPRGLPVSRYFLP